MVSGGSHLPLQTPLRAHSPVCGPVLADSWDFRHTVSILTMSIAFYLFIVYSNRYQISLLRKEIHILNVFFCELQHNFFLL